VNLLRLWAQVSAEIHLKKLRDLGGIVPEGSPLMYVSGYEAGFKDARTMAAERSDSYSPDDTDGVLGALIRQIGEEET
jgi:hypothetical protein